MISGKVMSAIADHPALEKSKPLDALQPEDAQLLRGASTSYECILKSSKAEAKGDYLTAVRTIEAGMRRFPDQEDRLEGYLHGLLQRVRSFEASRSATPENKPVGGRTPRK
ncbi:MAG TPA: hypothetical protein VL944_03455 [Candidatus Acidoferrum sp.]|nr:hypothetical protein [Candidatus Acidoferrum sp.]